MKQFIIAPNDAGQRLDKFLRKATPLLPPSLMYKSIRTKRIKVNRKRCQPSDQLQEGDVVDIYLKDELLVAAQPLDFLHAPDTIRIVYEDSHVLLVDKPPGLLVHQGDKRDTEENDTLLHRIQHYLYNKKAYLPEKENSFAPALCNRIDRNTGGIVIAAKTFEALQILTERIRQGEVRRYYLCAVHGTVHPKERVLRGYHTKDARSNTVRIHPHAVPNAKLALTKYCVVAQNADTALLEVELLTGRSHQIRAHLASIGHPLLGDRKYAGHSPITYPPYSAENATYQALYSYKVAFCFSDDAGALSHLSGRSFTVKREGFTDVFR